MREISWTNNMIILSKSKSEDEKEFYIRLSIKERLSKRELERQMDSATFERVVLSDKKLSPMVREIHPVANLAFKDNYILDFLSLPKTFSEKKSKKIDYQKFEEFYFRIWKRFRICWRRISNTSWKKRFLY